MASALFKGDLRDKVIELMGRVPQVKAALRLALSKERVSQLCDEIFGKGVAVKRNRVSVAGKRVRECIEHIFQRKNGKFLLWVAEEAMRRGLEVSLPLNPRNDYNVLLINGHRVNVQVASYPSTNITTIPLYHWELHRGEEAIDCRVLLALVEGFVKYTVIMPVNEERRCVYLPFADKFQRSRDNKYLWGYLNRWDLFDG